MKLEPPRDAKGRPIVPSTKCAWNDHGYDCGYAGILSHCTNGAGPWYCREHWYKLQGYPDMEQEGLHGNQLPQTPLHSYAVDEVQAKLKRRAEVDENA